MLGRNSTELDASLVQSLPGTSSPNHHAQCSHKEFPTKVTIKASHTIRAWVSTIRLPLPVSKTTVKFWCASRLHSKKTWKRDLSLGETSVQTSVQIPQHEMRQNPKSYHVTIFRSPACSQKQTLKSQHIFDCE